MNERILMDSDDPEICYQKKNNSKYILATFENCFVVLPANTYTIEDLKTKPFEIVLYNYSGYLSSFMREVT